MNISHPQNRTRPLRHMRTTLNHLLNEYGLPLQLQKRLDLATDIIRSANEVYRAYSTLVRSTHFKLKHKGLYRNCRDAVCSASRTLIMRWQRNKNRHFRTETRVKRKYTRRANAK